MLMTASPPPSPTGSSASAARFLAVAWRALGGDEAWLERVDFVGDGDLPSAFAVSDLAAASVGAAALAVAERAASATSQPPRVVVDRRLASLWFGFSLKPQGWTLPPVWDPIAGDYPAADGWIRLHTNAARHREAALAALGCGDERDAVAAAVRGARADELETAIVARGGCAAVMRSLAAWTEHRQGRAVAAEPLILIDKREAVGAADGPIDPARPLADVRVLDLTRILAGPVATRFLAAYGADVLRLDPPDWDEPSVAPEVTLGKRCARLDLKDAKGRARFLALLAEADVLVHGYRPGALDALGLGEIERRRARPGLVDVSLDAYGWSGPWAGRRGFDSLVQMSAGIAEEGMRRFGKDKPTPLPVQALDHAAGYFLAAAAVRGLTERATSGVGSSRRLSLARVAALLANERIEADAAFAPVGEGDFAPVIEPTDWGPARRFRPPAAVEGAPMLWTRPAGRLGAAPPAW
jgi:crotonobetainyl-CoA:carnitine CoA-transferase CaiB-like acyl-CoA transferase